LQGHRLQFNCTIAIISPAPQFEQNQNRRPKEVEIQKSAAPVWKSCRFTEGKVSQKTKKRSDDEEQHEIFLRWSGSSYY
jgi:hypothetical protein